MNDAYLNSQRSAPGVLADDETLRPFPMARLEKRTDDCLSRIREEARRIAEETRDEIDQFRRQTEETIQRERTELDAERAELVRRAEELNRREKELNERIADESWDKGYRDGLDAGREDGFTEGKKEALSHWESEFSEEKTKRFSEWTQKSLPAMESLIAQLGGVRQSLLAYWEKNILQIAAAIAHQTILRELPKMGDLPVDLLRESLELAIGCAAVKIRMNPSDLTELRSAVESLLTEFTQITSAELIEDARVTPGGCVVESALGTIDQRLESRLERIIAELSQ